MLLALAPEHAMAQATGTDGCWQPEANCLSAQTRWHDNAFATRLTNGCKGRVYVQICQKRRDRTPDCGEFAIGKGQSETYETAKVPTGASNWIYVGSDIPEQDFNCTQKLQGWYEFSDQFVD